MQDTTGFYNKPSLSSYLGLRLPSRGLSSTQSILSREVRVNAAVCRVTSGTFGLDFLVIAVGKRMDYLVIFVKGIQL